MTTLEERIAREPHTWVRVTYRPTPDGLELLCELEAGVWSRFQTTDEQVGGELGATLPLLDLEAAEARPGMFRLLREPAHED